MSTASRQGPWPSLSRFLHSPTVDTILQPSVQFGDANQPWRLHLKVKANRGFLFLHSSGRRPCGANYGQNLTGVPGCKIGDACTPPTRNPPWPNLTPVRRRHRDSLANYLRSLVLATTLAPELHCRTIQSKSHRGHNGAWQGPECWLCQSLPQEVVRPRLFASRLDTTCLCVCMTLFPYAWTAHCLEPSCTSAAEPVKL